MGNHFRTWLNRYPAVMAVSFLALGIIGAAHLDGVLSHWWPFAVAIVLSGLALVRPRGLGTFLWPAVATIFLALGWHGASTELSLGKEFKPPASRVVVHATVVKALATGPDFRILLLDAGRNLTHDKPLPGKGRLFLRQNDVPLCWGDRIAFLARLRKPVNRCNPGEYDWELDNRHNGIGWLTTAWGADSVLVLARGSSWHPEAVLFRVRAAMSRFLEQCAGSRFADPDRHRIRAVMKGVVLGDYGELNLGAKGEIDYSLSTWFARSGLAHMLSASGLHVGIVVLMVLTLVKVAVHIYPGILLWMPSRKLAALASVPAIMVYCLLAGSRVPTVRAAIMGIVLAAAVFMDRRSSSFHSLAIAALLVLSIYPVSLFTVSFQLSFAAVFGILFVLEPFMVRLYGSSAKRGPSAYPTEKMDHRATLAGTRIFLLRWAVPLTVTPVAATAAVAPLLVQYFHNLPVYSLFANVLADLAMTVGLPLGLIATAIGPISTGIGTGLLAVADVLVRFVIEIARFFANLPGNTLRIGNLGPVECAIAASACLAFLYSMRSPSVRSVAVLAMSAALLAGSCAVDSVTKGRSAPMSVTFLNVGNGDTAFLKMDHSRGMLIDGGLRTSYFDSGWSIVVPFLAWTGTRSLDAMILTHPDADHMGGLLSVTREVPPRLLLRNIAWLADPMFAELLAEASRNGVSIQQADRTCAPIRFGDAIVTFLNPPRPAMPAGYTPHDLNNASVVCRVQMGSVSFLFTGDLEKNGEDELLAANVPLQCTVLKVGHHGSKTSTSERFLDAVRPEVAVVSADYPPRGGLPNVGILGRLQSRGIRVFWTGRDGAITVETDGRHIMRISTGRTHEKREKETIDHVESASEIWAWQNVGP